MFNGQCSMVKNLFDLNTKIVLRTTALLIVIGTVLIAFFEWDNTFAGMRIHEKLVQAFFNAVSPRTAGFISVNLNNMCIQSVFIYTILMWIGGASQSTAGGVKVNAFAVAFLNIRAIIHGTTRVEFSGRELSTDSIRRANAAVFVSLMVLGIFIFLVTLTEPDQPLKAIVFECVSAFAPELQITPRQYHHIMKCIIIGLGTYGRVMVDELSALGHEVIAADSDASRVERVKDICDAAFQIDACDELALNVLPLKKVDVVIVAVGSNLGASVRVVALLKKLGVKHIYARANDYVHKSILQAFDIEKILIPEERAARSLVRQMDLGVKTDLFRIDDTYCVYQFRIPEKFVGRLVNDLHLYDEYHLKIIAVKKAEKVQNFIGIEYNASVVVNTTEDNLPLQPDDVLVCYGKESDFRRLCRLCRI